MKEQTMKISVKALFKVGGIRCTQKLTDAKTGITAKSEAKIAYATRSTVAAARALSSSNPEFSATDGDPDISYGSIVAVARNADGIPAGKVVAPGEEAPFFLLVGDKDFGMTGTDMLPLREAMVGMTRNKGTLTKDQSNALVAVQEIFEMVASAPDIERFPSGMISQAYHATMIDIFGEVEIPIDAESFAAKSRGDLYRARIGMLDPTHPDAMGFARPLRDILSEAGIDVSENGVGADITSHAAKKITEEAIRRTIQSNERMCNEVFGAMTGTPVDRLSAAMIPLKSLEKLRTKKSDSRLSGGWVDHATTTARSITQGGAGVSFELDVFSEKGRDYLAISDSVGKENDVAFVYSWPTSERIPVYEIGVGRVLNVSPEEVPDEAELSRLSKVLGQLEAVNVHDPDIEMERQRFDQ
jgi:hypothetical protein